MGWGQAVGTAWLASLGVARLSGGDFPAVTLPWRVFPRVGWGWVLVVQGVVGDARCCDGRVAGVRWGHGVGGRRMVDAQSLDVDVDVGIVPSPVPLVHHFRAHLHPFSPLWPSLTPFHMDWWPVGGWVLPRVRVYTTVFVTVFPVICLLSLGARRAWRTRRTRLVLVPFLSLSVRILLFSLVLKGGGVVRWSSLVTLVFSTLVPVLRRRVMRRMVVVCPLSPVTTSLLCPLHTALLVDNWPVLVSQVDVGLPALVYP